MKTKRVFRIVLAVIMILSLAGAQAATVADRVQALESAVGMAAQDPTLEGRVRYLEEQLGVVPAPGATMEDRISALEATLGLGGGSGYDNGAYEDTTVLSDLPYFTKQDFTVDSDSFLYADDNYGNTYGSQYYSDEDTGYVEYNLDRRYTVLTGTLYVTDRALKEGYGHKWESLTFSVYGDGKLLYTTRGFNDHQRPMELRIDVSGVEFLQIRFDDNYYYDTGMTWPIAIFGDPVLTA